MQQYRPNDNSIHIFYEGKDDPSFYSNFIEPYKKKNQRLYYYRASNKNSVYQQYSLIDWTTHQKNRILFFVDKDLSDIITNQTYPHDQNIFITKYYSIENYLVTKSLCARCLRELIGLDDDKEINKITKEFIKCLFEFHIELKPLMALILFYRSTGEPVNLNNLDLSLLFDFKKGVNRKVGVKDYIIRTIGAKQTITISDLKSNIKILNSIKNSKEYVRGKYEIWFFVHFINSIPNILNQGCQKGDPKFKFKLNFTLNTAVQVLAPRLRIPSELKEFLDNNLKKNSA